jgi:hypothetical protein
MLIGIGVIIYLATSPSLPTNEPGGAIGKNPAALPLPVSRFC